MYYVLFEEYTEYNQFEGEWYKCWNFFDNLSTAQSFQASHKGSILVTTIGLPLTKISTVNKIQL